MNISITINLGFPLFNMILDEKYIVFSIMADIGFYFLEFYFHFNMNSPFVGGCKYTITIVACKWQPKGRMQVVWEVPSLYSLLQKDRTHKGGKSKVSLN